MRFGTKIFFSITVFFSAAFLIGGYILLSYFYEMTMDREVASAVEQYQYNKFVLQANLITRGQEWLQGAMEGAYDIRYIVSDMNDTVAVFSMEGDALYSDFPLDADFADFLAGVTRNRVDYRFVRINNRMYLLTAGSWSTGRRPFIW